MMSKFLLNHLMLSRACNLASFFSRNPFSSLSVESTLIHSSPNSFTVDYLTSSCGLTLQRALSVSKLVKFKVADKPDSVLAFFKDHGFTQAEISKVLSRAPQVLTSDPEKTLLPKIKFLKSKGLSDSDVTVILCWWPRILLRSLENHLIPSFNFFKDILQSSQRKNITAFKRCVGVLLLDVEKHGAENIDVLKKAGVPLKNIASLLANHPGLLMANHDKFRKIVDEVTKTGIDPSKIKFLSAVRALRSMTKSTWYKKVEIYKEWGWSPKEIDAAFCYQPMIMSLSEDNINSVMEYWVNRMGWESSYLATNPTIFLMSMKKKIVPRCEVYQSLLSKGVKKPCGFSLLTLLTIKENVFLQKLSRIHEQEAPGLLKLYDEKLKL